MTEKAELKKTLQSLEQGALRIKIMVGIMILYVLLIAGLQFYNVISQEALNEAIVFGLIMLVADVYAISSLLHKHIKSLLSYLGKD